MAGEKVTQPPLATREEWMQHLVEQFPADRQTVGNGLNIAETDYLDIRPGGEHRNAKVIADALHVLMTDGSEDRHGRHQLINSEYGPKLARGGFDSSEEAEEIIRDPDVADYLDMRAESLKRREEMLYKMWPEIKQKIIEGLGEGRQLGFVPSELTADKVTLLLDSIVVQMRDPLLDGERGATYSPQQDLIHMFHENFSDTAHFLIHELRHRISGGTYEHTDNGEITRNRTGFQTDNNDMSRLINGPLDEAVNEHITIAILHGEWTVLRPSDRNDEFERGTYPINREFLAELIDKSGGLIDLATITRASFEDTVYRGGVWARREMMRQFLDAYEPGTVSRFSRAVELLQSYEDKHGKLPAQALSAIQGPRFSKQGTVVEKGYIDITYLEELLSPPSKYKVVGDPLL